ncbi:MAG TPA: hypothetical protein VGR19_06750 [Allosphingosinicella sp.]|nr:hypothetical protein [Allosphingosinicella sp.]
MLKVPEMLTGWAPAPISEALLVVLLINLGMLVWRLAMRFGLVTYAYGWREGLRSIPRVAVGNAIAMLAAWRAIARYRSLRKGGRAKWYKTATVSLRSLSRNDGFAPAPLPGAGIGRLGRREGGLARLGLVGGTAGGSSRRRAAASGVCPG